MALSSGPDGARFKQGTHISIFAERVKYASWPYKERTRAILVGMIASLTTSVPMAATLAIATTTATRLLLPYPRDHTAGALAGCGMSSYLGETELALQLAGNSLSFTSLYRSI